MRIALFVTCLADALYPRVGQATVTLLERLGHEVVFPDRQTCCGQMHINTGYQREALPLVRHYADVFADVGTPLVGDLLREARIARRKRRRHAVRIFVLGLFVGVAALVAAALLLGP